MAEPIVAGACERAFLSLRPGRMRQVVSHYFSTSVATNAPSLTEVVLATLARKAGLTYECMNLDLLYANPERAEQLLAESKYIFLSTTYLHDLSELETVIERLKRPHHRLIVGGALVGILAKVWQGASDIDLVVVGYGEMLIDAIADWIRSDCRDLEPSLAGRVEKRRHSLFLFSGVPSGRSLDDLATPDWGQAQRDHGERFRMIYYESVRGCPYRCSQRCRVRTWAIMCASWTAASCAAESH